MNCTNCGKPLSDDVKFCSECGEKIVVKESISLAKEIVNNKSSGNTKDEIFNYNKVIIPIVAIILMIIAIIIVNKPNQSKNVNVSLSTSTPTPTPLPTPIPTLTPEQQTLKDKEEADKKKQEDEKKKAEEAQRQVEAKKKHDGEILVDKDGKTVRKLYLDKGIFAFTGDYKGDGNFIVKLKDSNYDLYETIVNEIGDYKIEKIVPITQSGYYIFEVYGSDGTWEYGWSN